MSGVSPINEREEKTGRIDVHFEESPKTEKRGGILEGIQDLLVSQNDKSLKDTKENKVSSAKTYSPQTSKVAEESVEAETQETKTFLPEHLRYTSTDPEKMPGKVRDNSTQINLQYQMQQNQNKDGKQPAMFGFMSKLYKMLDLEYQQHAKTDGALYTRKELREVMQAMAPMVAGQFKDKEEKNTPRFSSYLFEKVGKLQESLNDLIPMSFSFSAVK